jgi:hypothetical protein
MAYPAITAYLASYNFTIYCRDSGSGVNTSTITNSAETAVRVTGPLGFSRLATLVSKNPASGNAALILATYSIAGPFDPSTNGSYAVNILDSKISDVDGNFGVGTLVDTFSCEIPSTATLLSYPSDINTKWGALGILLYKATNGTYFSNATPDSYQTTTGAIAYSSPAALSTGAGSQSDPKRLTELLGDVSVGIIYLAAGDYNDRWAAPVSRNLSVVCPSGKANINKFDLGITWVSQGGNVWLASGQTGACGMVQDFSVLDSYGNPKKMELRLTQSEVTANANSFFLGSSGNAVYVRTFDNRSPDANIKLSKTGVNGVATVTSTTFYAKNLIFNSGTDAFLLSGNSSGRAIFNGCTFRFGQGNNLSTVNATQHYLFDCFAFHARKDGFNYHVNSGTGRTFEQNCIAKFNGVWANETNAPKNNGSTIHDGGLIIRLNGLYEENMNRQCHDVSPNTISYNVGCIAGKPVSANTNDDSASFSFGLFDETATNAKAWYIKCVSSGGGKYDLQLHPGTTGTLIETTFASQLIQGTLIGGADITAPLLTGVSISAALPTRIVLQYNEALNTGFIPAASAFTVPGKTVSTISASGAQGFVDVTAAYTGGQTGTVAYTVPGANGFRDAAGNVSASFSAQSFSLPATDTTPPALTGVFVDAGNLSRIVLQYNEALNTGFIPAASAFTVPGKTVSTISALGLQGFVDVSAPFPAGASSSVAYASPGANGFRDSVGNISDSFAAQAFTVPNASIITTDFKTLTASPSGYTLGDVTVSFNSTTGVTVTRVAPLTPSTDGRFHYSSPTVWDQSRDLIVEYLGATTRFSIGITPTAPGWASRANNLAGASPHDTLYSGRTGIGYGNDLLVSGGFNLTTNAQCRTIFRKEGADVRIVTEELVSSVWTLKSQAVAVGGSANLAAAKPFFDSRETDLKVQRVIN